MTIEKDISRGPGAWFLARLPVRIRDGLDDSERAAIAMTAAACNWGEHPVDIRLHLPLPFMRAYFTLVAGLERRTDARQKVERAHHPLLTLGNVAFGVMGMVIFYIFLLAAILLSTRVLEY